MQDIHTHLYWQSYDEDRDLVVARARQAGVKELFVIGCTVEESRQAVALAERYDDMYAAIGIHPHEMNTLAENPKRKEQIQVWIDSLRHMAQKKKVVAIGECGLDYYTHSEITVITEGERAVQKMGFVAQIDLARELGLPLILHCRTDQGKSDAYEDLLALIQASDFSFPVILHCYMGDTEVTKKFLTLPHVLFSFTGNITYPVKKGIVGTKGDLRETVKLIPLNRIFAETDCPFLSPQSKRGERNEPQHVVEVYTCIALLQGKTLPQVVEEIDANSKRVFVRLS
jgi:TatD DNase family protein